MEGAHLGSEDSEDSYDMGRHAPILKFLACDVSTLERSIDHIQPMKSDALPVSPSMGQFAV